MMYAVESASDAMTCMPGFITIGSGIQETLRYYFNKLRGCNVGIAGGRLFMKYSFDIASNGVTNVSGFIKIG
jgi:hypothetical protein